MQVILGSKSVQGMLSSAQLLVCLLALFYWDMYMYVWILSMVPIDVISASHCNSSLSGIIRHLIECLKR